MQENAKYCVTLALKTVIYQSKLLDFQGCESLVFDVFLSKTQKKGVFWQALFMSLLYIAMSLLIAYVFAHGDAQRSFWAQLPKGLLISSGLWVLAAYHLYHFKKK